MIRVHHLNCGTDCPFGGRLMDGVSNGLFARLVCHCLLLETSAGLVLVDTGYGLKDVHDPFPRLSRTFAGLLNIRFRESETAIRQIEALGFSARDVRHIVLTHLDFDHAGGLEDFPEATVHLMSAERDAALVQTGFRARRRYRPRQFNDIHSWKCYTPAGANWNGFETVRELHGLPPEILMVPLPGHTRGHAGIAIDTGRGWLLHAGDAYFYRGEMGSPERHCTIGLRLYQRMMEVDRPKRLHNQERLRELSLNARANVQIICAHDAVEYEACLRASAPGHDLRAVS